MAIEPLEGRRLLTAVFHASMPDSIDSAGYDDASTVYNYGHAFNGAAGQLSQRLAYYTETDYYDDTPFGNETLTLALSNLPKHAIVSLNVTGTVMGSGDFSIKVGDTEVYHTPGPRDNGGRLDNANFGISDDADSITVTITGTGFEDDSDTNVARGWGPPTDYWYLDSVDVSVEKPAVWITSSPKAHGEEKNDPTMTFQIYRTGPTDYALPVELEQAPEGDGDATEGSDFTFNHSVTIPEGSDHADVNISILDDDAAEGDEHVVIGIVDDGNKKYQATGGPADGTISDDPHVTSIQLAVEPETLQNENFGYDFNAKITITGEALERVRINQFIKSSTVMRDFQGNYVITDDDFAQLAHNDDPGNLTLLNSRMDDYVQDPGWTWATPLHLTNNNGIGDKEDMQSLEVPGEQDPTQSDPSKLITFLANASRQLKIIAKSAEDDSILFTKNWQYTWTNVPLQWIGPAPEPCCTDWRLGPGVFDDVEGISGLV